MDSDTLRGKVRQIVGEMSPLGAREANSADRLVEELGYDSLAVIELSLRIEQDFDLSAMAAQGTPDITSVMDIENFVEERVAASAEAV